MPRERGSAPKQAVVVTENAPAVSPVTEVVSMPEIVVDSDVTIEDGESKAGEPTNGDNAPMVGTSGLPLDYILDSCPSTELKARYTDAERAELRRLYSEGKLVRVQREIEIGTETTKGEKAIGPYYIYIPVVTEVSDGLYDLSAIKALANGKVNFHADWPKNVKADSPEKVAQKTADESWGVVSFFDHGYDLKIRQNVRAHFTSELLGPVTEIAKQVRALFLSGFADSKQAAFDAVQDNRTKKEQPWVDGLTLEKLDIQWPKGK